MHCGIMHGNYISCIWKVRLLSIILLIFWMFFTFAVHDTTMHLLWFRLSHMLFNQCLHVDWPSEHSFECVRTYFWKRSLAKVSQNRSPISNSILFEKSKLLLIVKSLLQYNTYSQCEKCPKSLSKSLIFQVLWKKSLRVS